MCIRAAHDRALQSPDLASNDLAPTDLAATDSVHQKVGRAAAASAAGLRRDQAEHETVASHCPRGFLHGKIASYTTMEHLQLKIADILKEG
jgi:hypothetical protein